MEIQTLEKLAEEIHNIQKLLSGKKPATPADLKARLEAAAKKKEILSEYLASLELMSGKSNLNYGFDTARSYSPLFFELKHPAQIRVMRQAERIIPCDLDLQPERTKQETLIELLAARAVTLANCSIYEQDIVDKKYNKGRIIKTDEIEKLPNMPPSTKIFYTAYFRRAKSATIE